LAHNAENSFYDKKLRMNLGQREGKAKFLKHVCALANSNPKNNSYIVVGVKDEDNDIVGVDFFDDSKIQNLVNAYLENPPRVRYENVLFPHLPEDKVVGLIIIGPNNGKVCALRRNIWKYYGGAVFIREGSVSLPKNFGIELKDYNSELVAEIEAHSHNNVKLTLDGVFDFMKKSADYDPEYIVFKEYFVMCWAGKRKQVKDSTYYSRVNIELINERVKLFYSDQDEVSIEYDKDCFKITEYVHLGLYESYRFYPLEETTIRFKDNMAYEIDSSMLFEPPRFQRETLFHIYNSNNALIKKLKNGHELKPTEKRDLSRLPSTYLLCHLNDFPDAVEKLEEAKPLLKAYGKEVYQRYKESMRVLRKVKYS
jgi:hypothetical protein